MPLDEAQLESLIAAAVNKAVEDTTAALTEKFEDATKGLVASRDKILSEKKALENKDADYRDMSLEDASKLSGDEYKKFLDAKYPSYNDTPAMRAADRILDSKDDVGSPLKEVVIARGCSHQEYLDAKELAQKEGVPFRVDSGEPTPSLVRSDGSPVKKIETDTAVYVNNEFRREIGVQRAIELAGGKQLIVFRSPDELPAEAQAKHRAILEARDPDQLLFEGDGQ